MNPTAAFTHKGHPAGPLDRHHDFRFEPARTQSGSHDLVAGTATKRKPSGSAAAGL
jgi:hypothetical protein